MGCIFSSSTTKKSQINFAKKTAINYMEHGTNMYHTMEHIDDVVSFVRLVIASLRKHKKLKSHVIAHLENILIPAAYLHDIGHPTNGPREKLEQLVFQKSSNVDILVSMEELHIELCKVECGDVIHSDMLPILDLIRSTNIKTYSTDHNDLEKTIIRCADLSHFTFTWKKHYRSTRHLCNELDIYISPQSQINFIENIILPQFKLLNSLINTPESKTWLVCIHDNLYRWNIMKQNGEQFIFPDKTVHIGEINKTNVLN